MRGRGGQKMAYIHEQIFAVYTYMYMYLLGKRFGDKIKILPCSGYILDDYNIQ